MGAAAIDSTESTSVINLKLFWVFVQLILMTAAVHFLNIEADLGLTTFFPILTVIFLIHSVIDIK